MCSYDVSSHLVLSLLLNSEMAKYTDREWTCKTQYGINEEKISSFSITLLTATENLLTRTGFELAPSGTLVSRSTRSYWEQCAHLTQFKCTRYSREDFQCFNFISESSSEKLHEENVPWFSITLLKENDRKSWNFLFIFLRYWNRIMGHCE